MCDWTAPRDAGSSVVHLRVEVGLRPEHYEAGLGPLRHDGSCNHWYARWAKGSAARRGTGHGETTSSTAAALAAFNRQIPLEHVEAGICSHNIYSP